ncbi:2'-5' RNA ligase family protein [Natronococcus sp. JC468]|uniref:2'-5' RNA ligase family protein n=1 Tax=Natronococcus sp. JC468 TaxID=1961921 RepID=UPI001439A88B|nr:2'-5' RNA ligase family protein [Natronococcus sp. JC468]NKE35114.1 2'-5' RNA ligase family protein [Natronococcus sp. JC468]
MYSVTVPVPGRVRELATALYPDLVRFDTVRENHSCLLKRLGEPDHAAQLQHRTRRALEGTPPIEARVAGIDYFADPPLGAAPVVYLAVDSPALEAIHARLAEEFGAVDGLEGADYVPHVTLARGGDEATAKRLADRDTDAIEWTVGELEFRSESDGSPEGRIVLSG